jgi:hypothetical protein
MTNTRSKAAIALFALLAAMIGCGKQANGTAQQPNPSPGPLMGPQPKQGAGTVRDPDSKGRKEPKFKVTAKEFISEFEKNAKAFVERYGDSVIELEGAVESVFVTSNGVSILHVMPTGTIHAIGSIKVSYWTCQVPDAGLPSRVVLSQRIRVTGYLDSKNEFLSLWDCKAVELEGDDAIRVTAMALAVAASKDKESARREYSDRPAIITGVIKGKFKDEGGREFVELVGDGKTRILGSPCTNHEQDLVSPRVGEKITWTGVLHEQYGGEYPYILDQYWPIVDKKR